jgi:dihydroorotase
MENSNRLEIRQPDDWHVHLRDGDVLSDVVPATARQFARAIVMPNLKPPITTVDAAHAYRLRILSAVPEGFGFEPLMVLYLTDNTSADEVLRVAESPFVHGFKLYPSGATTNSDLGVSNISNCYAVLQAMERFNVPLLIHGEVTDHNIDVFDRESVFIDQVLHPLRLDFPDLRIVFEHITTKQAAQYVAESSTWNSAGLLNLAATITPQHLLFNRNAIFKGGLQPHWYCLPVLKREDHRIALLQAATSGLPQFFLGTDSAPHAKHLKEASCGCAGCYSAPIAMELYAQAFDSVGKLSALEAFASERGPHFYGLPLNTGRLILERLSQTVPNDLPLGGHVIVPLCAGERLAWSARLAP